MKQFFLTIFVLFASLSVSFATLPLDVAPSLDIEVAVYPNPTSGTFFLNINAELAESYNVKVVNLIGQSVWAETVTPNHEQKIDLSTAPKGVYFVQIEFEKEKVVKRIVLQ